MRRELDETVQKYRLIERTFEGFWANYDAYLTEEPEESREFGLFDRDSVRAELYGYSFCVTNALDFDSIRVEIDFFLHGKTLCLGRYWCIYALNGEEFDDYFVIE